MIPLFERYPSLKQRLPYVPLATLPTPVHELSHLARDLRVAGLYVKRDDLTGQAYGGNKVRKLEFILGEALHRRAKTVITLGSVGSNQTLATSIYAKQLGLRSVVILAPQPVAHYVRRNLLVSLMMEAELHFCPRRGEVRRTTIVQYLQHMLKDLRRPVYITWGGSSIAGTLGFVNAGLELAAQIDRKELPEPNCIYVTLGTGGTAAGLMIGLRLAGLKTRVVPVCVLEPPNRAIARLGGLLDKTVNYLRSLLAGRGEVPDIDVDTNVVGDFLGEGYACFTREGMAALQLMREREQIELDGTYTGKTLAALLQHARTGALVGQRVLFWDTLNSRDLSDVITQADYQRLSRLLRGYFIRPVQELDS